MAGPKTSSKPQAFVTEHFFCERPLCKGFKDDSDDQPNRIAKDDQAENGSKTDGPNEHLYYFYKSSACGPCDGLGPTTKFEGKPSYDVNAGKWVARQNKWLRKSVDSNTWNSTANKIELETVNTLYQYALKQVKENQAREKKTADDKSSAQGKKEAQDKKDEVVVPRPWTETVSIQELQRHAARWKVAFKVADRQKNVSGLSDDKKEEYKKMAKEFEKIDQDVAKRLEAESDG